jgi:hypothetical protein
MSKIFADCLVTGQPIDTGIEVDEASFDRLPAFVGKIFCPHCGSEHEWSKDTAQVMGSDKPNS